MLPVIMRLVWTLPSLYTVVSVGAAPYNAVGADVAFPFYCSGVDAAFYTAVRVDAAPYNAVGVDVAFPLYCDWCMCGPL